MLLAFQLLYRRDGRYTYRFLWAEAASRLPANNRRRLANYIANQLAPLAVIGAHWEHDGLWVSGPKSRIQEVRCLALPYPAPTARGASGGQVRMDTEIYQ